MKTIVVSSSMTLAVKYVLPAMMLSIFLPLVVFLFTGDSVNYSGAIPLIIIRLIILFCIFSIVFLWRITLKKLMRTEVDADYLYVSNYFQTVSYTYDSIERIEEWGFLLFSFVTVHLKAEGQFGKKILFWEGSSWREAKEEFSILREL